jgi:hypothetical protein
MAVAWLKYDFAQCRWNASFWDTDAQCRLTRGYNSTFCKYIGYDTSALTSKCRLYQPYFYRTGFIKIFIKPYLFNMSWKCNVVKILPIWCRIEKYIRKVQAFTVRNVLRCIALQRTNTQNLKQIFPEKELRVHSSNFHIHVSVGDLYIPTIDLPNRKHVDRSLEYINRSQTPECGNWD